MKGIEEVIEEKSKEIVSLMKEIDLSLIHI